MADELALAQLSKAIGDIESGGHDNPYAAEGPRTESGDRAYGKYQIMGNNIPEWSEEAGLGRMSPMQFMADPDAQEKVFRSRMGKYLDLHNGSVKDAASLWHAGVPYDRAVEQGRRDSLGTQTRDYADHVAKAVGDYLSSSDVGGEAAAPIVDPQRVLSDPKFWQLGAADRVGVMTKVDPRFAAMTPDDQNAVLAKFQPAGFAEPTAPVTEKPAWHSGLADEAGAQFADAVHNAVESAKSLTQAPEGVRQVVGDLLGMLEPWTVTGRMTGEAAGRGTEAAGGGPRLQSIARILGLVAGSMATPAPPGVGVATRALGRAVGAGAAPAEEAATAARAAQPEAAAAAETVAGAAPGAPAAPAAAGEALAPTGATTAEASPAVKTALGTRLEGMKDRAGTIYDQAVKNADDAGRYLDPSSYQALDAHLKDVRAKLGALPPSAEAAVSNLEQKIAAGQKVTASDLNGYKAAVDQTFPGKMKSGTEVRDLLRSTFSAEDREWAQAADAFWRDEIAGRGMTETSLGSLVKLIKKSDPAAAVEKLFGSGASDRQGAMAQAVLRHLDAEAPDTAKALKDAVFNRTIQQASGADNFASALLKQYDAFSPTFRAAISNPGADAFFTVLRHEAETPTPGRAAMMTARGLKIAGAGVAEAVGRHFSVPGAGFVTGAMELMIPTTDIAKFLTDSTTARLLARAMKTPANSAVVPTILKALQDSSLGQELLQSPEGQQKVEEARQVVAGGG